MAIKNEAPIRLAEVPAVVAQVSGERVNFKSVYRWVKFGKRGIYLETRPGVRRLTSREAVLRFLARLAGDDQPAPAELKEARRRDQAHKTRDLVGARR